MFAKQITSPRKSESGEGIDSWRWEVSLPREGGRRCDPTLLIPSSKLLHVCRCMDSFMEAISCEGDDNKTYSSAQPTTSEGWDTDTKFRFRDARPPYKSPKSHMTRHVSPNTVFANLLARETYDVVTQNMLTGLGMHWVVCDKIMQSGLASQLVKGSPGKVWSPILVQ